MRVEVIAGRRLIRRSPSKRVTTKRASVPTAFPKGPAVWVTNFGVLDPPLVPDASATTSVTGLSSTSDGYWTVDSDGNAHLARAAKATGDRPTFQTTLAGVQSMASSGYSAYDDDTEVILRKDGTVWTEGWGAYGQLGDGSQIQRQPGMIITEGQGPYADAPVQVAGLADIVQVANGGETNYALRADGTVWGWGTGFAGALANGSMDVHPTPIQIPGLGDVVWIAGYNGGDGYAVKRDGTVWVWGCEANAAHGSGSADDQAAYAVQQVPGLASITRVYATSGGAIFAIGEGGNVWAWGVNNGNATGTDPAGTDARAGSTTRLVLSPKLVPGVRDAVAVGNALILRADGRVYTWAYDGHSDAGGKSTLTPTLAPAPTGAMAISGDYVLATNALP